MLTKSIYTANTILLKNIISGVKREYGLSQGDIADRLSYSREHFSRLKKKNPAELLIAISNAFPEFEILNSPKEKAKNSEQGLIDLLILEVAKLKSKVFGGSVDDNIDELERNASLLLKQVEGQDSSISS